MGPKEPLDVLGRPGMDRIFDVLRDRRRRLILRLVKQGTVEHESDVMMRGQESETTVQIDLRHTHLPKLAEAGYIEWDQATGSISKGPRFDEIEPLLDLIERHADELPADWP